MSSYVIVICFCLFVLFPDYLWEYFYHTEVRGKRQDWLYNFRTKPSTGTLFKHDEILYSEWQQHACYQVVTLLRKGLQIGRSHSHEADPDSTHGPCWECHCVLIVCFPFLTIEVLSYCSCFYHNTGARLPSVMTLNPFRISSVPHRQLSFKFPSCTTIRTATDLSLLNNLFPDLSEQWAFEQAESYHSTLWQFQLLESFLSGA